MPESLAAHIARTRGALGEAGLLLRQAEVGEGRGRVLRQFLRGTADALAERQPLDPDARSLLGHELRTTRDLGLDLAGQLQRRAERLADALHAPAAATHP